MEIYKIWAIVGLILIVIEITTPTTFFLTLAGAAFFAGVAAFIAPENIAIQVAAFVLFVPVFCFAIRPYMKKNDTNPQETGVDAKYIGNKAQVVKTIGLSDTNGIGRIKIYGEEWQAKSCDDKEIKQGEMVKIVRNESLVMYVEKCE